MSEKLGRVYDLKADPERLAAMQRATLERSDIGLSASPAVVGTPGWWDALRGGGLPDVTVEGTVARVFWGSMRDWPMFELLADDGERTEWTRLGEIARYVEGLRARIRYTRHPWKVPERHGLGAASTVVIEIDLELSDLRSDPRAPGPGGVGLR